MEQLKSHQLSTNTDDVDNVKHKLTKKRKHSNALPSKEEQMHLRETANLMQSNFLNLQVDELLHEAEYDFIGEQQSTKKIKKWIEELKLFLQSLDFEEYVSNIKLEDIFETLNYTLRKPVSFVYHPPTLFELIGSFETKSITKPFYNIDIAMMMPNECFEARYFYISKFPFPLKK